MFLIVVYVHLLISRIIVHVLTHHYKFQCLKLMVAQSPLVTKNWAEPVKFDPGQVKIIIEYIRKEIFWIFLGD